MGVGWMHLDHNVVSYATIPRLGRDIPSYLEAGSPPLVCGEAVVMSELSLELVLFTYGLVLFAMGLAITLEIRRDSELLLARSLWWLAGFGLIHSVVEWLQMFRIIRRNAADLSGDTLLQLLALAFLVVSGFFLAQFGASLLASTTPRAHWVRWIPISLVPLWVLMLLVATNSPSSTDSWVLLGIVTTRYVLYVPGSILSGLALLSQRPVFKAMNLPWIARDCTWGAIVFGLKGIIGGLVVPPAHLLLASVVNYSSFSAIVGLPPEIFRALAAVGITFFVLRALRLFEVRRQQEMEHVSHQLKRLSMQALNVQEEERKRIARELHDDTAQLLSSLLLRLKLLERAKTLDEVQDKSKHIIELAAQATEGVRRMAFELRPAALEDLGLPAAIRWYSDELAAPRGLSVDVRTTGMRDRLPAQVELGLYRVVQEALTNVAKHSGARRACVVLEEADDRIRVFVKDDGCGFDMNEVSNSRERGLGLFGMRERVALLGGTIYIDSQPKKGTRINLEIPVTGTVGAR